MKYGLKMLLDICVGVDVDLCEKIEFKFKQGDVVRTYKYPSAEAFKSDTNVISLVWNPEDSARFNSGKSHPIMMDSRITLKDSEYQPETEIVTFIMNDSLFKEA